MLSITGYIVNLKVSVLIPNQQSQEKPWIFFEGEFLFMLFFLLDGFIQMEVVPRICFMRECLRLNILANVVKQKHY